MSVVQSIDNARAERIGSEGVAAAALNDVLENCEEAISWLRARYNDGMLPLLRLTERRDDLSIISDTARRITADATDVVFLGTGGSSLGGQTLVQLMGHAVPGVGILRSEPRLHFMDNLDPATFAEMLERLPLHSTRVIAISKSGGTAETLMQTIAALTAFCDAGLEAQIPTSFLGITEPVYPGKRNGLRDLLSSYKISMLDHDPVVGGRFSVLTNVGLLPAAIAGLDIQAVREGARLAFTPVIEGWPARDNPACVGAALSVALAKTEGKSISVMMAYADRLERFTRWYVQLWAESLGKNGEGTTPIGALGPVDQHSQLQLFIAGPRDKLFTIITVGTTGKGPRINSELAVRAGEPGLGDKTIGDLVAAQGRATAETLAKNGCPVRTIHIDTLDETSLGHMLMQFMLETIIAARLLKIDPFDQPAVEEGKILAKRYLAGEV